MFHNNISNQLKEPADVMRGYSESMSLKSRQSEGERDFSSFRVFPVCMISSTITFGDNL